MGSVVRFTTMTTRSRFVDTEGLSSSDLLKKKDILDKTWGKHWSDIYDTKYKTFLQTEILDQPVYAHTWNKAKKQFDSKKAANIFQPYFYNKFGKAFPADDFHIAIIAYTMEAPLYHEFNEKARDLTEDTFPDFPFKSLWYLLGFAVPQLENDKLEDTVKLYRGMKDFQYPEKDLKQAIKAGVPIVLGSSFLSTSKIKECAMAFTSQGGQSTKKCLITFHGKPNYGNNIKHHSAFAYEEEVLLCPWSQWIVSDVKNDGTLQCIDLLPNSKQSCHVIENKKPM